MVPITPPTRQNIAGNDPLPPRIGRYQLVGRLAKGGMAEAFLALSGGLPGLRTLVVVKRILPELSANAQFVGMFLDEARISALLDHPVIPRIIEVGQDEDGYFLAMEVVPGKPLSALLRRARRHERPIGQAHAAFIVGRAAAALGYAHALTDAEGHPLNVVHRDVSPENILVSFEGAVKVIDFGIASAHGRISQTVVGGLKGKVQYMSPEQAAGEPVDRRSDVFSLGIVLWEALSGRRLFRRDTDLAVMRAISKEPIPRPSGPRPIPPRLERIVMTALERAPENRFQDAHEMALRLESHAFRTDGFDPAELVTQIKQLFAADYAGWKATVASAQAQAIHGERPRKITEGLPLFDGVHTHAGEPTVALRKQQRAEAATHVERIRAFPAEPPPALETGERPALSRLVSWGGEQPEPGSDSGESAAAAQGNDAAAYAALRAWTSRRTRRARPAWLLAAAIAAAGVFAGLRSRPVVPLTPPSIIDARRKAAAEAPVVEPLESLAGSASPATAAAPAQTEPATTSAAPVALPPGDVSAPAATMPAPAPVPAPAPALASPATPSGAASRPALQRSPPAPARVVKTPAGKRAPAHRAAAAAKPAAPKPAAAKPAAAPKPAAAKPAAAPKPAGRPAWRDPFQ